MNPIPNKKSYDENNFYTDMIGRINSNPKKTAPTLDLGSDDFVADPSPLVRSPAADTNYAMVSDCDYKLSGKMSAVIKEVLLYFDKYPSFKAGLMTSRHIAKLCCVVERSACGVRVDKKAVALTVMEKLAGRRLTPTERELASNTIEFLHQNGLIKASFIQRAISFVRRIFR